uniref:Pseudouridine synthase I TruA alpha/beta domain-containing protein n=1 Tax=Arion vulgaris TaxID=1028688 RepID=A0A0B6Z3F8_9EUPU
MLKQILNYVQRVKSNSIYLKMAECLPVLLGKRPADSDIVDSERHKKKKHKKKNLVQLGQSEGCKRKIAMLVAYNGAGYYGVQVNPGFQTIESEIFPALVKVGAIPQDHAETPSKMWFQRGSRTDKGVSAVGQLFSMKAVLVPDLVERMNEILPSQIRVIAYVRTTNGFDSKNWCDSRTYMYMTPTFAFAPFTKFITEEYRTEPEIITKVRNVLGMFVGTHNFTTLHLE